MNELVKLGKRFVASKHWRWMPGMVELNRDGRFPDRVIAGKFGLKVVGGAPVHNDRGVPDLTDPATLGCLLALVRDVLEEPLAIVEVRQTSDPKFPFQACVRVPIGAEGWRSFRPCVSEDPNHSEAMALVTALETVEVRDEGRE